jgi:hypothetical protein
MKGIRNNVELQNFEKKSDGELENSKRMTALHLVGVRLLIY